MTFFLKNIFSGLIYLLCIPSMYLLLIIYSITNLNVVSWGTREVAVKKTKKELAEEKKTQENAVKKSKKDGGCLFTLFFFVCLQFAFICLHFL